MNKVRLGQYFYKCNLQLTMNPNPIMSLNPTMEILEIPDSGVFLAQNNNNSNPLDKVNKETERQTEREKDRNRERQR
jgi:hypothetical protein